LLDGARSRKGSPVFPHSTLLVQIITVLFFSVSEILSFHFSCDVTSEEAK
jgi:hypothetical protein